MRGWYIVFGFAALAGLFLLASLSDAFKRVCASAWCACFLVIGIGVFWATFANLADEPLSSHGTAKGFSIAVFMNVSLCASALYCFWLSYLSARAAFSREDEPQKDEENHDLESPPDLKT